MTVVFHSYFIFRHDIFAKDRDSLFHFYLIFRHAIFVKS